VPDHEVFAQPDAKPDRPSCSARHQVSSHDTIVGTPQGGHRLPAIPSARRPGSVPGVVRPTGPAVRAAGGMARTADADAKARQPADPGARTAAARRPRRPASGQAMQRGGRCHAQAVPSVRLRFPVAAQCGVLHPDSSTEAVKTSTRSVNASKGEGTCHAEAPSCPRIHETQASHRAG
jgi:hypothetical protein